MKNNFILTIVKDKTDVELFWSIFNTYIDELSINATLGDEFDLDYFYSPEYRDAIEKLRTRENNPLRILFVCVEEVIVGFLMYVTYLDEGGKCLLMEYYISSVYRGVGIGKSVYLKAEKLIAHEGGKFIELTPTNDGNEIFWRSVGFVKSKDMDEDNKFYYRKVL
ncbi:GNAT family N-acetyltransferase [Alkaliphilus transvaalensis]|uniref:GNAT family N-acetyltransferase n=1 Tax=Alkaliphilus transvaalensis TaxID=114628 RepID=UPI00047CAB74|nr:GNAT family N-acetyltransferase [Alkaliphilus transvaalensis]